MLSKIAGLLKSEMSRAAATFIATQSKFLSLLEAYKEKLPGEEPSRKRRPPKHAAEPKRSGSRRPKLQPAEAEAAAEPRRRRATRAPRASARAAEGEPKRRPRRSDDGQGQDRGPARELQGDDPSRAVRLHQAVRGDVRRHGGGRGAGHDGRPAAAEAATRPEEQSEFDVVLTRRRRQEDPGDQGGARAHEPRASRRPRTSWTAPRSRSWRRSPRRWPTRRRSPRGRGRDGGGQVAQALRSTRTGRAAFGGPPFVLGTPANCSISFSGALGYLLSRWGADGVVTAYRSGPYLVRGPVRAIDEDGNELTIRRAIVPLCRCGRSRTKPLCDGSHGRCRRAALQRPPRSRRPTKDPAPVGDPASHDSGADVQTGAFSDVGEGQAPVRPPALDLGADRRAAPLLDSHVGLHKISIDRGQVQAYVVPTTKFA